MWSTTLCIVILLIFGTALSDISHFLEPNYALFPHFPFPVQFPQPTAPSPTLPGLYQPPSATGYPDRLPPISVTQSPVAPTQSTTEFFLPEIIENRSVRDRTNFIPLQNQYLPPEERPNYESPKPPHQSGSGYYYPRPSSTSTTTTERSSPIVVVEPEHPVPPFQGYDYNAPVPVPPAFIRPSTPSPAYLPPPSLITSSGSDPEDVAVIEHSDALNPLRLRVKDMRCLHHLNGYFHAVLKIDSFITATPVPDIDSNDKHCELKLSRSHLLIHISADNFKKCGVYSCGSDLCLRLRFPAIRGMRTGNDAILTLHCKGQERVATKTHALKVGVANDIQARNIGTYAHGGIQNPLRTQIELLRRSRQGFTKYLESSEAVQLGEDLILRAHVLPGDGWNYTKLTDVSIQRISPEGELLNLANLIAQNGCLNPSMQSICSQPPSFDPPLGYKLNFKAVMFQGMHSGDELVISMRITACLEQQDCLTAAQQGCTAGHRQKRDAEHRAGSPIKQTEISEISRISFRVIMDDIEVSNVEKTWETEERTVAIDPRVLILVGSLGFVGLITCLGVIAAWKINQ